MKTEGSETNKFSRKGNRGGNYNCNGNGESQEGFYLDEVVMKKNLKKLMADPRNAFYIAQNNPSDLKLEL